jgi:hypothetical protein
LGGLEEEVLIFAVFRLIGGGFGLPLYLAGVIVASESREAVRLCRTLPGKTGSEII